MKKSNRKTDKNVVLWICVGIISVILSLVAATYAYFTGQKYYEGTFDVEVNSKGVDTLKLNTDKDINLSLDISNFSKKSGHDVSGENNLEVVLDTTKDETKYCYKLQVILPSSQIFVYSDGKCNMTEYESEVLCTVNGGKWSPRNTPEIVLDVNKSLDGSNYVKIIDNMDITTRTGIIEVPIEKNSSEYINLIQTTKNKEVKNYWKGIVTFKWLKNTNQVENDNKTYEAKFKAIVVDCETGEKYIEE